VSGSETSGSETSSSETSVGETSAAQTAGDTTEPESKYGDGSYVGTEPPEGFTIKGNERSKKYHVTGTEGYERTNADVWFNSEAAAEAAGFTKAKR
jgi:hypothetical protein